MTRKYRTRRGWFGKAILQRLENYPSFIGGVVDSTVREYKWFDVNFDHEPYSEFYPNREAD